jgi:phosphoribosylformylglycinamidine (FGAM) synthase PurS component
VNLIGGIREKIRAGKFEFSKHAADQSIKRNIRVQEMKEALLNGEVIEDYPDDKYRPS